MTRDLQGVVDALAGRVGRAVAVDDTKFRIRAYSSHIGEVDAVRQASILARRAPVNVTRWLRTFDLEHIAGARRLPASSELGMQPRIVAPIRCQGKLLGYLWLVDPDESLDEGYFEDVVASADAAGTVMYRSLLLVQDEEDRERELLRELLSDSADARADAADTLIESNVFAAGAPVVALVAKPIHDDGIPPDDPLRTALAVALDAARRTASPRHRLHLVRRDHGLFVAIPTDGSLPNRSVRGLARLIHDKLASELAASPGWRVAVGIGAPRERLAEAVDSYREAMQTVEVASRIRTFGTVAAWNELGIYRLLARLPAGEREAALPEGLLQLLDEGSEELVTTLETYFDLAGDAKATAVALSLHRASLYYRLHKIEAITGMSLRHGEDRLMLHIGLKLARLAGVYTHTAPPLAPAVDADTGTAS